MPSSSAFDTPRSRTRSWGELLVTNVTLWLAAATLAGVLHLAVARTIGLGFSIFRWGWDSRDLAWKVPLGYLLVFAPVALMLAVLWAILPPRTGWKVATWAWLTLVIFSSLLLFPAIHGYASLLLAVGLAASLSTWLDRHPGATLRGARVVAALGAVGTAGLSVSLPRLRDAAERRALAALPVAPPGAPSVLLLILDTVRADYTSLNSSDAGTTPNLQRWGMKGAVFEEAYSTAPWTTPSHASFFTGQYPSIHRASWTVPLADGSRTIAEVLSERGWASAGFTANYVATRRESGLAQGFVHFEDFKTSLKEVLKSTTITQADNVVRAWDAFSMGQGIRRTLKAYGHANFEPHFSEESHDAKSAAEIREDFLRWSSELPADRPYFAFLNFFDAHAPYHPPPPFRMMFGDSAVLQNRYRGGIRYIDEEVNRLLETLDKRGTLANTIVIVTADHGEQFGEHGLGGHDNSLYRQVLHVPMMILHPRKVPGGVRVATQVTGRDIPATILDLVGVSQDSAIGGTSLAPLWAAGTPGSAGWHPSEVLAEVDQNARPGLRHRNAYSALKAVIRDSVHVIGDRKGNYEAFAYRLDPDEASNLVVTPFDTLTYGALLGKSAARHRLVWPRPVPRAAPRKPDERRAQ